MKVFKFSELLIISFLVSLLTACSFFSFGGDFSEILNDSLKTKITYFDKNPLENEDAINFEVSYKIGSRQASLAQPEDKIKEFKTKHPGYNVGGWKYLCNALDNTITKVPEGIEILDGGLIGSLEIPVDAFWVYAFWVPATDTPYKVIHWTQNATLDGYEINLEENKTGTTETLTSAAALELEGFEALAFEQQSIDAEGKTVINIYYNRKKINISVVYNGNKKQFSGYYGQTLDSADFNVNDFAPDGYAFDKWTVTYADGSTEEIEDAVITFTKDGAEYTAEWKVAPAQTGGIIVTIPVDEDKSINIFEPDKNTDPSDSSKWTITLSATVNGINVASYRWYFNGTLAGNGSGSVQNGSYTISKTAYGKYQVVLEIIDTEGNVYSGETTLTI